MNSPQLSSPETFCCFKSFKEKKVNQRIIRALSLMVKMVEGILNHVVIFKILSLSFLYFKKSQTDLELNFNVTFFESIIWFSRAVRVSLCHVCLGTGRRKSGAAP